MLGNEDSGYDELGTLWKSAIFQAPPKPKKIAVKKASFWRRFLAYSIDTFILGIIVRFSGNLVGDEASGWGSTVLIFVNIMISAVYYIWPYSAGGQTLGKRLLGLRVVSLDGSPLTLRTGITRTLGYIPSSVAINIGFLWALWDRDKQAWHDKMAGTLVVPAFYHGYSLKGYIEPTEASKRQRKWEVGLGLPTILIIIIGIIGSALLIGSGINEVKAMGEWPTMDVMPEDAANVNLSHLGFEVSQMIKTSDEVTWAGARYEDGVFISFESNGDETVYIWALRYKDNRAADRDYEVAMGWAEQNCGIYTWRSFGGRGIINCTYPTGYDRVLRNQSWILNVGAFMNNSYSPEELVDLVLVTISDYWIETPELRE